MKITLLGYGKMGRLIEQLAVTQGHQIVGKSTNEIAQADVCIDFSHASCMFSHVEKAVALKKPLVIGTTGWESDFDTIKKLILNSSIGCIYSPNFSIGVYLFQQLISQAAKLMSSFKEYDVAGIELHHRHKADAPSGTAKALTYTLLKELSPAHPFTFTSVRCGSNPGCHQIEFDSPADTITLTHAARNRDGFASGAIKAAEWVKDKQGFFTMEDFLQCR